MTDFDVVIVGGGLVGASLAVALQGGGRRVALVEAGAPPTGAPPGAASTDSRSAAIRAHDAPEPPWDERCIALNDASVKIFTALGVWDDLRTAAEPIVATHISELGRFGVLKISASDMNLQALGYNVPPRAIGQRLWRNLNETCRVLAPARVVSVRPGSEWVALNVETESGRCSLRARLLAAADGASSTVRQLLGIPSRTRDYGQHAIVSAVKLARAHRGTAYERFTPEGPFALLPKPGAAASLIWTQPAARVPERLRQPESDYLQDAQRVFGGRLGRFLALGRRWSFPLARVLADTVVDTARTPRVVLLGNAAQSLHPVAAQGFNLGLRDVAALAQQVNATDDPGAAELLDGYAARRRMDRRAVADLTDLTVRGFSNRLPGVAQMRHWSLVGIGLVPPLRERIARQHLGYLGLPPGAARRARSP